MSARQREPNRADERAPATVPAKRRGLSRLLAALQYSCAGLRSAFASEEALRLECVLLLIFSPVAFYLGETRVETALLIGSMVLVLIVELLNTALETIVDRIGSEYHELSRRAKDVGSAAVFVAMLQVALVWALILF